MNAETTQLPELSFFTKVKIAIVAGLILCVSIMTSLFVLTISAILLPFVAIGIWFLQKKLKEQSEEEIEQEEMVSEA